ncbi:MAG TPA: hypothetical protein VKY59_21885 [Spirillospora sp.]|nr:hypothetical protein [Spirillospora sp.]
MSDPVTANRSDIEYAQAVHGTITADIRQTTGKMARRFLISALIPLAVFIITLVISGYVRVWVAATYQAGSLNLTTAISTTLVIIVFSWFALNQAERRWHGWAALRRLLAVLGALSRLETALDQAGESLAVQADTTWQAYRRYADTIGHPLPPLDIGQ